MAIALDIMGGDFSPQVPIRGAVKAVQNKDTELLLVGKKELIEKELKKYSYPKQSIEIIPAEENIGMKENILQAIKKRDSSLRVALELHKKGEATAVVSAGHSGAMLTLGKMILKTIKGIDRPCFVTTMPTQKGLLVFLDIGANVDCSPRHLLEFAILGEVYAKEFLSIEKPKIGLLNIGAEEGKGNELSKKAYDLFSKKLSNFVGNIEGKYFFEGQADVVVSDGFAGNILLKSVQGAVSFLKQIVQKEISSSLSSKIGYLFLFKSLKRIRKKTDYAEYGGAPILGLKGVAIVCHGSSTDDAIVSAIKYAQWAAQCNYAKKVEDKISQNQLS